jgi:hypothetical protein
MYSTNSEIIMKGVVDNSDTDKFGNKVFKIVILESSDH